MLMKQASITLPTSSVLLGSLNRSSRERDHLIPSAGQMCSALHYHMSRKGGITEANTWIYTFWPVAPKGQCRTNSITNVHLTESM